MRVDVVGCFIRLACMQQVNERGQCVLIGIAADFQIPFATCPTTILSALVAGAAVGADASEGASAAGVAASGAGG